MINMDDIFSTMFGLALGSENRQEVIGRDAVGKFTIDTCLTADQGWETAVWVGSYDMIIVGRYPTKRAARKGHKDWCSACKLNPVMAYSVQNEQYEYFEPVIAEKEM